MNKFEHEIGMGAYIHINIQCKNINQRLLQKFKYVCINLLCDFLNNKEFKRIKSIIKIKGVIKIKKKAFSAIKTNEVLQISINIVLRITLKIKSILSFVYEAEEVGREMFSVVGLAGLQLVIVKAVSKSSIKNKYFLFIFFPIN